MAEAQTIGVIGASRSRSTNPMRPDVTTVLTATPLKGLTIRLDFNSNDDAKR